MRDQRTMTGHRYHDTVSEVEAAWVRYGQKRPAGWEGRTVLLRMPDPLTCYASAGRWVADCPECNGGIACWKDNPQGACLSCGRIYPIRFPKGWETAGRLLDDRPKQRQRNWLPGEPVSHLAAENTAHGIGKT